MYFAQTNLLELKKFDIARKQKSSKNVNNLKRNLWLSKNFLFIIKFGYTYIIKLTKICKGHGILGRNTQNITKEIPHELKIKIVCLSRRDQICIQ